MTRDNREMSRRGHEVLVCVAALFALASGCTDEPGEPAAGSASDGAPTTVRVETRSLTATVVLNGTVAASPEFLVEAPAAGLVRLGEGVDVGANVEVGAPLGTVGGAAVVAPAPGTVSRVLRAYGAAAADRLPLVAMTYAGFGVHIAVPPTEQYRLRNGAVSAKATVTGGPAGIDCALAPAASVLDAGTAPAPQAQAVGSVLCLLPLDAPVLAGLEAKVGLHTGRKDAVLTLPLQAVSGRADRGQVTKVDGDRTTVVDVGLGMTDGVHVEITSGLDDGDVVLSYAPGLG